MRAEESTDPINGKLVVLIWEAPGYFREGTAARLLEGAGFRVGSLAGGGGGTAMAARAPITC